MTCDAISNEPQITNGSWRRWHKDKHVRETRMRFNTLSVVCFQSFTFSRCSLHGNRPSVQISDYLLRTFLCSRVRVAVCLQLDVVSLTFPQHHASFFLFFLCLRSNIKKYLKKRQGSPLNKTDFKIALRYVTLAEPNCNLYMRTEVHKRGNALYSFVWVAWYLVSNF